MKKENRVIVLGGGFSGLSAATTLAHIGYSVKLIEKNEQTGGRARVYKEAGFVFDMGPSWYWMPDVIEKFFNRFGKSVKDYFELERLDPSYQVIYSNGETIKLPADFGELKEVFERIESGSGKKLELFLEEAKYKPKFAKEDNSIRRAYKRAFETQESIEMMVKVCTFILPRITLFSTTR